MKIGWGLEWAAMVAFIINVTIITIIIITVVPCPILSGTDHWVKVGWGLEWAGMAAVIITVVIIINTVFP